MSGENNVARRAKRGLRVLLLVTAVLTPLHVMSDSPFGEATGGSSGTVTGRVFQDFNSNGVRNTTVAMGVAVDAGVAGIVVRAFDSSGAQVGSTTSGADGTYSLSVTGAASTDVRVEFSVPSGVAALEGLQSSFATSTGASGSTAGSAVQFATLGNTNVNHAVNRPGEYCQNNPTMVTCSSIRGTGTDSTVGAFTFSSAMPDFANVSGTYASTTAGDYNTGTKNNNYAPTSSMIGPSSRLGATFGIGTDRNRNAFFGTYVRRHAEYGFKGNTNTIYRINTSSPGTVAAFVTLPGTLPLHDPSIPTGFLAYSGDTEIFQHVGRVGLGDVDITPDGKTLLAVDMDVSAPKLYFVPIEGSGNDVTAGTPRSLPVPRPSTYKTVTCPGDWHPMGLGTRGSRILVGGVCGAEDTVTPQKRQGDDPTKATAFILEYSGALDGSGSFTTIWAESLGYERGCVYRELPHLPCDETTSTVGSIATADWGAWNDYPTIGYSSNPQPMLSNIEILDTGGLVVGFRDRYFDQNMQSSTAYSRAYEPGSPYPAPALSYPRAFGGMAGGDILRVCSSASGLVTESGGTCPAGDYPGTTVLDASGSREYYGDAFFAWIPSQPLHSEVFNGSLASMPGYSGLWTTAYDVVTMGTQGVYALGPAAAALGNKIRPAAGVNGEAVGGYGYQLGGLDFGNLNSYNKGNALADLEIFCDAAPVQVGDRVWVDTDGDGVQDAGEEPVAGVTVNLYDSAGQLVATTVTNADGEYLFSSTSSGLTTGAEYVIRFDDAADYAAGGPLEGLGVTVPGASTPVTGDADDGIDSDAVPVSGFPQVTVGALSSGQNDHSFDVGFVPLVGVGDRVWVDADGDGVQDAGESGLSGATVELLDANGYPARDAFGNLVPAQTTGADGAYFFDGLAPGDYRVKFTPPAGYAGTVAGEGTSATGSDADRMSGVTPVFTVGPSASGDTIADVDSQTTARFVNPTVAAGFVPVVSVGDLVWLDTDADGVQDAGEPGIADVTVALTNADGSAVTDVFGNPVTTAVTDAQGRYEFLNLPTGQYSVTVTPPSGFVPTVGGRGSAAADSSTGSATSVVLSTAGASDMTLDFGFVPEPPPVSTTTTLPGTTTTTTVPAPVEPSGGSPSVDPPRRSPMPLTGGDLGGLVLLALLLLVAGAGAMRARRQQQPNLSLR